MYKMIKRTKPCLCRYKPHTPCWMSLFEVYSCRVPFDNDRQWSCYLMISNRFVHIKWGKFGQFWLKRKRHDSDHIHTLRTDRRRGHGEDTERTEGEDGRSAPGGASLATFPVWGVLFNWFPLSFDATFLTIFHSFPKSMFWPCFNHCSDHNRLRPGFRHCSRFVPVFLCPRLVSKRPF